MREGPSGQLLARGCFCSLQGDDDGTSSPGAQESRPQDPCEPVPLRVNPNREASYNARRNQRDLAKREQLTQKLSAAQEAEAAKMAQFRALLAHGPISIPKRQ